VIRLATLIADDDSDTLHNPEIIGDLWETKFFTFGLAE
jgi:hypothetical protein